MTSIDKLLTTYEATLFMADSDLADGLTRIAVAALKVLHKTKFGEGEIYLSSGMGSCYLHTDGYKVREIFQGKAADYIVKDSGVLDYFDPSPLGGRPAAELLASTETKKALQSLFEVAETVKDANISQSMPSKLYHNSK